MSRYRVTETRQILLDAQWVPDPADDPEALAVEEARALPATEWDTLSTEVEAL